MVPFVNIIIYFRIGERTCHMVSCVNVKIISCANTYLKYSYKAKKKFLIKQKILYLTMKNF